MADVPAWIQALEASGFAAWVRGGFAYPLANVLHLLGMALIVAPMMLADLRLLGVGRTRFPVPHTIYVLGGCAIGGAMLAVVSGTAMFAADATSLATNPLLQTKLLLLALAGANALVFHLLWSREVVHQGRPPPPLARAQLLLSITLWLTIPVLGRLIAYV